MEKRNFEIRFALLRKDPTGVLYCAFQNGEKLPKELIDDALRIYRMERKFFDMDTLAENLERAIRKQCIKNGNAVMARGGRVRELYVPAMQQAYFEAKDSLLIDWRVERMDGNVPSEDLSVYLMHAQDDICYRNETVNAMNYMAMAGM